MKSVINLIKKIESKEAKVGIVGLGYVGSSVAEASVDAGFDTLAFEIDLEKIKEQNKDKKSKLKATNDWSKLSTRDIICICVPTPLNQDNTPNFDIIKQAATTISKYLRKGQLISTESSLRTGITRNLILPTLEKSKLKAGKDFFLVTSPERIDPGNKKYKLANIPKVVGGIDKNSLKIAKSFYSRLTNKVVPVSSPEAAELTKLLENIFRFVNISLINEISDYAKGIGVNIREVISAASTKPFGFLPHFPSCGIGGYCIPVLPYFLLDDAQKQNLPLNIIKSATLVNESRPKQIIDRGINLLKMGEKSKSINNKKYSKSIDHLISIKKKKTKIFLVGVSYKAGSNDSRESAALKVWKAAEKMGAEISYHDPYVPFINNKQSMPLNKKTLASHDLIIITTPHKNISYKTILNSGKPIVDAYNILPT